MTIHLDGPEKKGFGSKFTPRNVIKAAIVIAVAVVLGFFIVPPVVHALSSKAAPKQVGVAPAATAAPSPTISPTPTPAPTPTPTPIVAATPGASASPTTSVATGSSLSPEDSDLTKGIDGNVPKTDPPSTQPSPAAATAQASPTAPPTTTTAQTGSNLEIPKGFHIVEKGTDGGKLKGPFTWKRIRVNVQGEGIEVVKLVVDRHGTAVVSAGGITMQKSDLQPGDHLEMFTANDHGAPKKGYWRVLP